MGFVYNLLLFPTVKYFENRLVFDEVITISWVVHFLGHTVVTYVEVTLHFTRLIIKTISAA